MSSLKRAPLPSAATTAAAQAVVNRPQQTVVHPLLVVGGRNLAPAATLTVVGADLPMTPHKTLLVLQGPGFRGQRLVGSRFGVVAATIILPRRMRPGQWFLAFEDLSGLHVANHRVNGQVRLDLGIYTLG